jgi:hypothetical protein
MAKHYIIAHWIEILAIIISVGSAFIAYLTWHASFLLTNRPYVWAENFGYLENEKVISPLDTVMIRIINSPAQITSESYIHYTFERNKKTIIEEQSFFDRIIYPDEKSQYTYRATKINEGLIGKLSTQEELYRLIRLNYKWLSSNRNYFFEGLWKYDKKDKTWKLISQKAN